MQELSVKLHNGAYAVSPKAEQRMLIMAMDMVLFHAVLLTYLIMHKGFLPGFFGVFLLQLLVVGYFIVSNGRIKDHSTGDT